MVSYYNSLAMFPQPGRPAPSSNPSIYSSYGHAYPSAYSSGVGVPGAPQHDQNSNFQLYAGFSAADLGHSGATWPHSSAHHAAWSAQFPSSGSCRTNYESWATGPLEPPLPPGGNSPATPNSDVGGGGGLASPRSPGQPFSDRTEGESGSPPPPNDFGTITSSSHFKPSLTPPLYKTEPPSSSVSELGLPASITVTAGPPPNMSLGPDLDQECHSPSESLTSSRPQPARSPFEWMKKPSYPSPTESRSDPNDIIAARTRTKDKYRVVYSDHQRLELEKEFHYSRYITIRRKAELSNAIGLSERQVKIWFQNRRAKERRSLKKQDDTLLKDKLDSSLVSPFSPPSHVMMGNAGLEPSHFAPNSLSHLGFATHPQHHHFATGFSSQGFPPLMKFE